MLLCSSVLFGSFELNAWAQLMHHAGRTVQDSRLKKGFSKHSDKYITCQKPMKMYAQCESWLSKSGKHRSTRAFATKSSSTGWKTLWKLVFKLMWNLFQCPWRWCKLDLRSPGWQKEIKMVAVTTAFQSLVILWRLMVYDADMSWMELASWNSHLSHHSRVIWIVNILRFVPKSWAESRQAHAKIKHPTVFELGLFRRFSHQWFQIQLINPQIRDITDQKSPVAQDEFGRITVMIDAESNRTMKIQPFRPMIGCDSGDW